jgi:hypothetical protein
VENIVVARRSGYVSITAKEGQRMLKAYIDPHPTLSER